jgi:hypothetical protein
MAKYAIPGLPPFEHGNWEVRGRCCTSGRCSTCKGRQGGVIGAISTGITEARAKFVAKNWKAYDAVAVELVPMAEVIVIGSYK